MVMPEEQSDFDEFGLKLKVTEIAAITKSETPVNMIAKKLH